MSQHDRRSRDAAARSTVDVVVVGGGPAGLAAAIACSLRGLSVRVVDARSPGADKACGEGLMPDAVEQLECWGVRLRSGHPLSGIRYLDETYDVDASSEFPVRAGLGLRRTQLHECLTERALELGARVEFGRRVTRLGTSKTDAWVRCQAVRDREDGAEEIVRGRWVVGADGLHSRVRSWAGLAKRRTGERYGVRQHFRVQRVPSRVEVHWSDGCEAYVTPIGEREVGVALLCDRRHGLRPRFAELLGHFPRLRAWLEDATPTSRPAGAGPFLQKVRRPVTGRLALVGDAAGYVDAITGEGLALSFHQAEALAESLHRDSLRPYARAWRRDRLVPDAITRLVLLMSRSRRLRRRALVALQQDERLFDGLIALHVRAARPWRAAVPSATRLAWRLAVG